MVSFRIPAALLVVAALVAPPAFATNVHRSPTSGLATTHKLSKSKHKAAVRHTRGQQAIDPERVTQIQQALIRENYMTGEANGNWDASTVAAMQKYQADHGWQIKLMPDSRALLKLGLGPDYSTAINAKGSSFAPAPPKADTPPTLTAGFVAGSGVNQ
jgi:peptidoglycan hydrolase-like protein with peptidoglycan-binding domain